MAASIDRDDKETVQNVMLGAVEKRFGQHLPEPLEWLTPCVAALRWEVARYGHIYAGSFRNLKKEKTSEYIGLNLL